MKSHQEWQPEQYLRFKDERTQPAMDLARRVDVASPERILDVGCGPGNSTAILAARWPGAAVTGMDSSEAMLKKARETSDAVRWVQHDAHGTWENLANSILFFQMPLFNGYREPGS